MGDAPYVYSLLPIGMLANGNQTALLVKISSLGMVEIAQ